MRRFPSKIRRKVKPWNNSSAPKCTQWILLCWTLRSCQNSGTLSTAITVPQHVQIWINMYPNVLGTLLHIYFISCFFQNMKTRWQNMTLFVVFFISKTKKQVWRIFLCFSWSIDQLWANRHFSFKWHLRCEDVNTLMFKICEANQHWNTSSGFTLKILQITEKGLFLFWTKRLFCSGHLRSLNRYRSVFPHKQFRDLCNRYMGRVL